MSNQPAGQGEPFPGLPGFPGFPGMGSPEDFAGAPFFAELAKLLSSSGPVNWELARQVATTHASRGDAPVSAEDTTAVQEAVSLGDLWLEDTTTLPAGARVTEAWTRVRWVEATLPVWATLCDPVAGRVAAAMQTGLPEETRAEAGPLLGVMGQVGGLLFGMQVGQALGSLAGEVLTSTDIGLPLGPEGRAALLPASVAAFGEGLGVPATDVRLFLGLREAAYHRLYSHVGWLRGHVLGAVETYARGITVDADAVGRLVAELDPSQPEALQEALSGGLLEPQATPEQAAALARLETILALVEGWVDEVTGMAVGGRLPTAGALGEALRRRRATGGPAEQTFATLVGLELRPRRLREAAALWRQLTERRGVAGRDAVWGHPDLLPGAEDLTEPSGYLAGPGEPLLPPVDPAPEDDAPG